MPCWLYSPLVRAITTITVPANDYRNGTVGTISIPNGLFGPSGKDWPNWVNDIRIQQTLVYKDKQLLLERIRHEIDETALELREKLEELSKQFEAKAAELAKAYRELKVATEERRRILLIEIKRLRRELRDDWKNWVSLTELTEKHYALA